MKIIVIGGTGTIGKVVTKELSKRHQVVIAGRHENMLSVDINDIESIKEMYEKEGDIDAVVTTLGRTHFDLITEIDSKDYDLGLQEKLMGQVNVVLQGLYYVNDKGSFTLTSGILNYDPIPGSTSAAMVNGAIDAFVKAASFELPRGLRINTISPTVITESLPKYGAYFRGYLPVSAAQVALAYSKSVEGLQTGQVFKVGF